MRNGKRVPLPSAQWPERMTPEQLADCLGFGIDTIRYAINFQGLKFKQIGQRRQLIKREDALEWLDETGAREKVELCDVKPIWPDLSRFRRI